MLGLLILNSNSQQLLVVQEHHRHHTPLILPQDMPSVAWEIVCLGFLLKQSQFAKEILA